jgi:hypothetical protein
MQSVTDLGAVPNPLNAVAPFVDSYPAFQTAADSGKPTLIPAGVGAFYLSQPVVRRASATDPYAPGMKFYGEDRDQSVVWSGVTNDAAFKWDVATGTFVPYKYTVDSALERFSILPAPGVAALRGLSITAAQYLSTRLLHVEGFAEHGIVVPWRADLNPSISDPYQCLRLAFTDNYVRGCGGHGYVFGAGQSPGLWEMVGGEIRLNQGSGVVSTTGQFVMRQVTLAENVRMGLDLDPTLGTGTPLEGPTMCGEVSECEFDTNGQYQLVARDCQNLIVRCNRFLTAPTALHARHIVVGLNGYGTCVYSRFESNYHRSTGSNEVFAYTREPNSNGNLIDNPMFGPMSSGTTKYYGFAAGQSNRVVEANVQVIGP